MASTGYVYDERYLLHKTGTWHPERPERLLAIHQRLQESGLLDRVVLIPPYEAPLNWIETLHDRDYIDKFRRACEKGQQIFQSADNGICRDSYRIALLAVGGVLAACDAMMSGKINNAFCAVRPPGHHAERARAMGFCFFNNIALGARYLQEHHGLKKIAIVDWDVHHGNGTQHLFEEDPSVLYISLHEDPSCCYPGTGRKIERGRGAGLGFTLNIPMAPNSEDQDYHQAFDDKVLPALKDFDPEALMLSAGFDAHQDDPLAHINLTREGYQQMGQALAGFAQNHCGSRIITILEGGYNLQVLADCIEDHIHILQSI